MGRVTFKDVLECDITMMAAHRSIIVWYCDKCMHKEEFQKSKVRYLRKIVLFGKTVRTAYKRHTQYSGQEGDDKTCQEVFQAH
jgi:hypothetical protein